MAERLKDVWKYLLGAAGTLLLIVASMLWDSQVEFVKRVEARVCKVEDGKADKEEVRDIKAYLIRIEGKIDRMRR